MQHCLLALDLLNLTSWSLVDYDENLATDLQNPNLAPIEQGRDAQNQRNFPSKSHLLSYRSDDDKVLQLLGVCGPILPTYLSILPIRLKNEAKFSADSGFDTPHVDTNIDSLGFSLLVSSMKRHLIVFQCSDCVFMSAGSGIYDVGELSRETRHRPPREFE